MLRTPVAIGAVVFLVAAVGVSGLEWSRRVPGTEVPAATPANPEQLIVVPEGYDSFGEVWLSKDFVWSFPVMNRGDLPVVVKDVVGSCTCLSVSPQSFTIAPGQSQIITARIDFTLKPRKDEHAAFAMTYLTVDDAGQLKTGGEWVLFGKVRPLVTLNALLDFGQHSG